MPSSSSIKIWAAAAVIFGLLCAGASAQDAQTREAQPRQSKGVPARATPSDYQAHAKAGNYTIAAEFTGHSIATADDPILTTDDYVVVEVGIFGPPQSRLALSPGDFSLRVNGKKAALPGQPYALVFSSLKDPNYTPPGPAGSKSKTSLNSAGEPDLNAPPPVVHIPIDVERKMERHVQDVALPEGDRALPEAGLLFFRHHGKTTSIQSLELIYEGPAGKATLPLQP